MTLLDRIKESQPSRIVVLSSLAHDIMAPKDGINFDLLDKKGDTTPMNCYGRSKLANVLFSNALARRLVNTEVYVNSLHPGAVATELNRNAVSTNSMGSAYTYLTEYLLLPLVAMTPKRGALTQLYLATSPEVVNKNIRGSYFVPIANEIQPNPLGKDAELQEKLWAYSEKIVREKVRT